MKTKLMAAGLTALTLLGAGLAAAQPVPNKATITRADVAAKVDARFDRLDANHDGKLSPEDRAAGLALRFKALDSDGNGALSLAEFSSAMQKRGDGMRGGHHRGGHGGIGHGAGFGGPGGQPNAVVTKAEFQTKALARFDQADANHDGKLTPAERQAAHAATHPRA